MGCLLNAVLTRGFASNLLLKKALGHNLFTGNMTVVRQHAGRPVHWIVREKLTIRSERLIESASYDIA
jgi:hypothetical protein